MQQPHILWLRRKTRPILLEPLLIHCWNLPICTCFHYHFFCIFRIKKPCLIYVFLGIIDCLYDILSLFIVSLFYSGVVCGQTIIVYITSYLYDIYTHIHVYVYRHKKYLYMHLCLYVTCDITYIYILHIYTCVHL